jgi:hypothetical protein
LSACALDDGCHFGNALSVAAETRAYASKLRRTKPHSALPFWRQAVGEKLLRRIGIDRVAIGSDFDGPTIPAAIKDASGLPNLITALQASGFDEDLRRKTRRAHRYSWGRPPALPASSARAALGSSPPDRDINKIARHSIYLLSSLVSRSALGARVIAVHMTPLTVSSCQETLPRHARHLTEHGSRGSGGRASWGSGGIFPLTKCGQSGRTGKPSAVHTSRLRPARCP